MEGDSFLMVPNFQLPSASALGVVGEPGDGPNTVNPAPLEHPHRARNSDDWTLETVYSAHFRFVWRCLRNLGVPEATLDDAVQEVFLVVDRKLATFSGEPRPWLYAIVRRIALRHRKRIATEAHRFTSDDRSEHSCPSQALRDLRDEVEKREALHIAFEALDRLDDEKREVFVFCMIEGLAAPEVASIVGVPINTVYSRLRAARLGFQALVSALQQNGTSAGNSTVQGPWRQR